MVEGPSPVAVGLDELDDGMLGGGPGSEACPAAHLVLHRGEERLGHGVVVQSPVRLHDRRTSLVRTHSRASCGVLGAPIAAEYGVSSYVSARLRRLQRRHRDVGGHAVGEQPPTTMRVHRSTTATRKSQPSPVRRYVKSPTSL